MKIKQPGKIPVPKIIRITLFTCLMLLVQPALKNFHSQSSVWAGNSGWNNAFDASPQPGAPPSREAETSDNSWNTVIDDNSYNPKIDNNRKIKKNSRLPGETQTQTNSSTDQPEALELIDALLTANQPAEIPPTLYINNMTKVQYAGAVSMAMEGMRLFYGDMDADQEGLFKARWLPLFRYPNQDVIYYVNHLNPLLLKFLTLRAALNDCIEDFNATQLAVMSCTEIGDAAGVSQAMETAVIYAIAGKALNSRLQSVGKKIIALGEPPNAAGLMKKARQKNEDAFAEFTPKSIISITPSRLNAVPGREYTFTIKIADYEKFKRKDKLHISCEGREKIKNGILIIKRTFHKKIGSTDKLIAELHQYPGPKILGSATADITMVKNPGCWTLVDCHTYKANSGENKFLTYTIDKKNSRVESSFTPPSFTDKNFHFGYLSNWEAPAQRLSPETEVEVPVKITRLHSCAGFNEETRNKLSADAYDAGNGETADAAKEAAILKKLADYETCLYNCDYKLAELPNSAAVTVSLISDSELSQRMESNPWQSGSLNKAVVKLKSENSKTQALLKQTVPSGIPEERYDKNKAYLISLHIQVRNEFYFSKNCDDINREDRSADIAGVVYVYQWDPTGNKIKPLNIDSQEVADAPASPTGVQTKAQKKAEKIDFHQHNIKYFTKNIKVLKKQLKSADNPEARNQLTRNLLYAEDARQRELDAITTIKTGEFVRTRTELDALNMKIMAAESRKMEARFHREKRMRERGPRLIALAPKADRWKLMNFFKRNVLSERDPSKMSKAMQALSDKVSGGIEAEIAKHEEEAQYWDENLKIAQATKTGAEYSLMLLSFTGASAAYNLFGTARMISASGVYMAYGATSGYLEGGWKEAVSQTLAAYNTGTTIIHAGMQGYQAGVLQHLEEYAQNPQKVDLDEEKAGFKGAAWSAGTAAAFACAIHFGMKAYQNRQQIIKNRKFSLKLKCDQSIQQARAAHFKQRTMAGAGKVKIFRQRQIALSEAAAANAPKSEILRLRCELDKAYKDIKTDYFAKKIMKSMAAKAKADFHTASGRAHHKTVHAYNSIDRRFTKQLKTRLSERMREAGCNHQEYKPFSNSCSKGGIGMDVDMGAVEPPRYITVSGRRVPNPDHVAWRRNLTRTVDGVTHRISPYELQKIGQQQIEKAFHDVYGRRPGEAMVSYTTSYHPEAYRDPRWLGSKGCKTALVYETDPHWTQQAADVTDFKINTMDTHNPSLGYYGKMQENCRGLVKDFNTKLKPLLKHSQNQAAKEHMEKLMKVMDQFANNKIGPVKAEQTLRILTGNQDGIKETSQRFSTMLQGLKKMPAAQR